MYNYLFSENSKLLQVTTYFVAKKNYVCLLVVLLR